MLPAACLTDGNVTCVCGVMRRRTIVTIRCSPVRLLCHDGAVPVGYDLCDRPDPYGAFAEVCGGYTDCCCFMLCRVCCVCLLVALRLRRCGRRVRCRVVVTCTRYVLNAVPGTMPGSRNLRTTRMYRLCPYCDCVRYVSCARTYNYY